MIEQHLRRRHQRGKHRVERALAVGGHRPRRIPASSRCRRLFEERAAVAPDALAIVTDAEALTYAQLNDRANQLAHYLRARFDAAPTCVPVHGAVPVGLGLTRSIDALIAQLAILKAGGAYVPLDPALPRAASLAFVRQAGVQFVLTNTPARPCFSGADIEMLDVDADHAVIAAAPSVNSSCRAARRRPRLRAVHVGHHRRAQGRRRAASRHRPARVRDARRPARAPATPSCNWRRSRSTPRRSRSGARCCAGPHRAGVGRRHRHPRARRLSRTPSRHHDVADGLALQRHRRRRSARPRRRAAPAGWR